jgi:hypothetical protein
MPASKRAEKFSKIVVEYFSSFGKFPPSLRGDHPDERMSF